MQEETVLLVVFTVIAALTSSCVPNEPIASTSPLSPAPSMSPLRTDIAPADEPEFSLDEPLLPGDTQVSGAGPYGLHITIVDVTLMGEVIGRGDIGPDGHFEIQVNPPLIANHRIGIMVDAQETGQISEAMLRRLEDAQGEDAITLPRIGRIYDAASVQSGEAE